MSTKSKAKRTQAWRRGAVAAISLASLPVLLYHLRQKMKQDPRNDDEFEIIMDNSDLSPGDRRTISNFMLNAKGDDVHKHLSMLGTGIKHHDFLKATATIQAHFKKRKPAEKRQLEMVGEGFLKSLRPNRKKFTRAAKILGASALGAALLLHPKSRDVLSGVVNNAADKVKGFKDSLNEGLYNNDEFNDAVENTRYLAQNVKKRAKRGVEDFIQGKPDARKRFKRGTEDFKDFTQHKANQSKSWIASNILD